MIELRATAFRIPAALAIVFALTACGPPARRIPSLLLITVDTLRPDYLSINGFDLPTSPSIDALVRSGFYFEQAVSPVPRTTPALAALLTGSYPHTNDVRRLTDRLSDGVGTLAEVLQSRGYQTLAVVTNQVMTRDRGLDRGFDVYDLAGDTRLAKRTTDVALGYLEGLRPGAPAFAWVHYIDPHAPYHSDPAIIEEFAPGYRGRYAQRFGQNGDAYDPRSHQPYPDDLPKRVATHRNPLDAETNAHVRRLYAADIRSLDTEVGRLVDAARQRMGDDLLIVFTADHGESLGEHDFYFDHGDYVYNAGTRVPLAFVLPGSHPLHGHGRCSGWVSLVDVLPTVFDLLDQDPPAALDAQMAGQSLIACMRGEPLASRPVFAESGFSYYLPDVKRRVRNTIDGRFRAVVKDDWKLIYTPFAPEGDAWQLYDLAADPHEAHDVYRPDHPMLPILQPALEEFVAHTGTERPRGEISPADADALRALGYLDPSDGTADPVP